jgi:hypothetical protein
MKKLLTFEGFINESKINEAALNAMKASKAIGKDFNAQLYIEEKQADGDDDIANTVKQICDFLGELPTNVIGIDQYTEDTDELIETYDKITEKFRGGQLKNIGGKNDFIRHDPKMGIVEMGNTIDDFMIYWFTGKSKF